MPEVVVENLTKRYGRTVVLDGVAFDVGHGELFTLLGPSGCGKTTTLLSIAGFLKPDSGSIACGGTTFVDATAKVDVPAERRNLGMVFQSYAIWPHMTVAANVEFPLRIRKLARRARRAKVQEALELVELAGLGDRYPHQLSGGQRQRVALARALVYEPSVLLLDEPFSNLDAKLRERARAWFKRLQKQLALTTLFVTHDQDEAMELSDRILVMDQGRIQQIGTPKSVYQLPANRFVAGFVGRCNFLDGVVVRRSAGGLVEVRVGAAGLRIRAAGDETAKPDSPVIIAIRPEAVRLLPERSDNGGRDPAGPENVFDVAVNDVVFLGDHYECGVTASDVELKVHSAHEITGGHAKAVVHPGACVLM